MLRMNHRCTDYIWIEDAEVEDVESFVYLLVGLALDKLGGIVADIKRRLALARAAFTRLQNIWRSGRFSQKTKLRILHSNVLSMLLYGAEMWRIDPDGQHDTAGFATVNQFMFPPNPASWKRLAGD